MGAGFGGLTAALELDCLAASNEACGGELLMKDKGRTIASGKTRKLR